MNMGEKTRRDFPILSRIVNGHPLVYLDSAASSQKPLAVIEAVSRYYETSHANVHRSIHTLGEEATERYEAARDAVRAFVGARSREEIIFTRGTTEGINLVAQAVGRTLKPGDEIIVSELEHHSNLIPWQMACRDRGAVLRAIPVVGEGYLDLDAFDRLLSPRTRVVAVAHVSNVLGTINPVTQIAERAHRVGALVLLDGAQAVPHLPLDLNALGADFYAFSGHKMLGPTGSGALWARRQLLDAMPPFLAGGEMIREVHLRRSEWNEVPWKFEAGTPDIASSIGFGVAADYLRELGMDRVREHEKELLTYALVQLMSNHPEIPLYGPLDAGLRSGVVPFNVPGVHAHDVAQVLDRSGVAVRAGHHCTMPLHERLDLPATVRASFNVYTTKADIDALISGITEVKRLFGGFLKAGAG